TPQKRRLIMRGSKQDVPATVEAGGVVSREAEYRTLSAASFIRWSGLALLVAGVLTAIVVFFHPSDADPFGLLSPLWPPVHFIFGLAFVLSLFGLIGLHLQQAD